MWLKKLKSKTVRALVVKEVDARIDEHITENISLYFKQKAVLSHVEYDINSTDDNILEQLQLGKLRAVN